MKCQSLFYRFCFCIALLFSISSFISCGTDESDVPDSSKSYNQTVLMYMPWAGGGIYTYFLKNIASFETAIKNNHGLDGNALIVFISENENKSNLIKITYNNGECRRDTIQTFDFDECNYTTSTGISSIISDVVSIAPAKTYALAIGCHGMGWLPAGTNISTRMRSAMLKQENIFQTRYFGHSSDIEYQTDITTLAEGIKRSGVKMEYIMFDDCYMSNIETAYNLKDVTNYLIASTCEIMIEGMPYAEIGIDLLKNNYKGICDGFYSFYSNYMMPCGTIGITDCREVERMAAVMKDINTVYPNGIENVEDIQDLDGYTQTIFFDFGDYVSNLCQEDGYLLSIFNEQLKSLVPYKANTDTYYSMLNNRQTLIKTFSGLTISDPTENSDVIGEQTKTSWYRATH